MINVLQQNLNHSQLAQDMLMQTARNEGCDIVLIADPYRIPENNGNWVADPTGRVAAVSTGRYPIQRIIENRRDYFVVVEMRGIVFCSVYLPPVGSDLSVEDYRRKWTEIASVIPRNRDTVIGGDVNAWSGAWGMERRHNDGERVHRGAVVMDAMASLELVLLNRGNRPTWSNNSGRSSIIDVSFCSSSLLGENNWRVCDENPSDHNTIKFAVGRTTTQRNLGHSAQQASESRWATRYFNKDLFVEILGSLDIYNRTLLADELTQAMSTACDATMPRLPAARGGRRSVYWWNNEISQLRRTYIGMRRRLRRARTEEQRQDRRPAYTAARAALEQAVKRSKKEQGDQLPEQLGPHGFGPGYKIRRQMWQGARVPMERDPAKLQHIVGELFPVQPPMEWPTATGLTDEDTARDAVTEDELVSIAKSLNPQRAPGDDNIPNVALIAAMTAFPRVFMRTFQHYIDSGHFPVEWKRQRLVLFSKAGKPPGESSSYRPICLLSVLGKVLERLIQRRLTEHLDATGGLADAQYGFRKGRSTMDAINRVIANGRVALDKKRRGDRLCAMVTIDVKNAFNTANWTAIGAALQRRNTPPYLQALLRNYFTNRTLHYETDEGMVSLPVSAGVPQGSVLGPTLWNVMYDDLLRLELFGKRADIIGFADDVAFTLIGRDPQEISNLATRNLEMIERWMDGVGLKLAHQKTGYMIFCTHHNPQVGQLRAGGHTIVSTESLKYLGVELCRKQHHGRHLEKVCSKASRITNVLTALMPNKCGPKSSRRRPLVNVGNSIVRYAAPSWGRTLLQKDVHRTTVQRTHRTGVLRVASAFQTVSYDAACVVASTIPLVLLLEEDIRCHDEKVARGSPGPDIRKRQREETMGRWQQQWTAGAGQPRSPGMKTRRIIPDIMSWVNRKHGEIDFYLSQLFTGHGFLRSYFVEKGILDGSPNCPVCEHQVEDVDHVMFHCPRFARTQHEMQQQSHTRLTIENLAAEMCANSNTWEAVRTAARTIFRNLQVRWNEESPPTARRRRQQRRRNTEQTGQQQLPP